MIALLIIIVLAVLAFGIYKLAGESKGHSYNRKIKQMYELYRAKEFSRIIEDFASVNFKTDDHLLVYATSKYYSIGKEEGRVLFRKAFTLTGNKDYLRKRLGDFERQNKEWEEAIKYYQEMDDFSLAYDLKEREYNHIISVAECYIGLELYEQAILQLKKAPTTSKNLYPELYPVLVMLGDCFELTNNKVQAKKHYDKALSIKFSKDLAEKVK